MGEDEKGGNMSKIAGELNAEMMHPKVIHEQRKALFAEMVGKTGSTQSVLDRLIQEIAELRQQLADRDEQISDLTISSDTYFAERNSARDVWRRASKDRDELRQQLAAAQEREQTNDILLEQQGDKLAALNDLVSELRQQLATQSKYPPESLTWVYTHCRAIGMDCKSDSGKWEHDIALFTSNQKTQIESLRQQLAVKQAEIDDLMLKYCRNKMTPQQFDNWTQAHGYNVELKP